MRKIALALVLIAAFAMPSVSALSYADLVASLTLGVSQSGILVDLALHEQNDPIAVGEHDLLAGSLKDPLSLLELPRVPEPLLAKMTVDSLGNVIGPQATEIPAGTVLTANAIDGGPIRASTLAPSHTDASVRQEPPAMQAEDLHALMGDG